MKYYFPEFQDEIAKTKDSLPGCETPMNSPFLGFVVNVNAKCKPHRDTGDSTLYNCIVLPFGNFEGGEIVFKELGLVIKVTSGIMCSFLSQRITHWNLEVEGERYSLVCHTDKSIEGYVRHRNHWSESMN